jgi:hypothetical protein
MDQFCASEHALIAYPYFEEKDKKENISDRIEKKIVACCVKVI